MIKRWLLLFVPLVLAAGLGAVAASPAVPAATAMHYWGGPSVHTVALVHSAAAAPVLVRAAARGVVRAGHAVKRAVHRACTWTTSYTTSFGPPGKASVTFNSISPVRCEFYRMTIQSTAFPNLRYHSGWIGSLITSSIDTTHNPADGSTLKFAWEDRKPAGSSTWQCRGLFPVGTWGPCSVD